LQRGIIRVDSLLGAELAKIIVKEPIGMHRGKKTGHVFTASCEFLGTLRQSGCKGICINAYVQDGLLHSSLTRLFTARHVAFYLAGLDLSDSTEQFQDTDWTFSVKCSSHVCSNSLEKGFRVIPDKAHTVDELHIVTASFINGSYSLYTQLSAFLLARLCFRDDVTGPIAERTEFWSYFVEDANFLNTVVAADLWFHNGCLYVNNCVQSWEDPVGIVTTLVMFLLRWVKFIETRWCGCRLSSIYLLRSYAGGAEGLAAFALEQGNVDATHLGGFRRATVPVRLLAAIAAFCAGPSDRLLELLFEDDRLLLKGSEYLACVRDEVASLQRLGGYTWKRVATLISEDFDVKELIHLVMKATFTSVGYCWRSLFLQLEQQPLSITQGDIGANLRAFLAAPLPDPCAYLTAQIYRSGTVHGLNVDYLVRALSLARKLPCSTNLVEQGHGCGATIMKHHQRIGEAQLRARSTVFACKSLVRKSSIEKRLDRLRQQLDELQSVRSKGTVAKDSGFHVFLEEVSIDIAREVASEQLPFHEARRKRKLLEHDRWAELPQLSHARYNAEALNRRSSKQSLRAAEVAGLRNEIALLTERCSAELAMFGVTNHMSSCRFSPTDLRHLAELYDAFDGPTLERLEGRRFEAPEAPSDADVEMFEGIYKSLAPPDLPAPQWLPWLAVYRDRFSNTAFVNDDASGVAWAFLYASQNPRFAIFLKLQRRAIVLPSFENMSPLEALECGVSPFDRAYDYADPLQFASDETVPFAALGVDDGIGVLEGLRFRRRGVSMCMPIETFLSIVNGFPPPRQTVVKVSSRPKRKPAGRAELIAELRKLHPWLTDEDVKACGRRRSEASKAPKAVDGVDGLGDGAVGGGGGDSDDGSGDDSADEPLEVDELSEVSDGLEALHHEYAPLEAHESAFRMRVRTKRVKDGGGKVAHNVVVAEARFEATRRWCDSYEWPPNKEFAFSVYGHEVGVRLATEFLRRSNYYFNIWLTSGDEDYRFDENDDKIADVLGFVDWMLTLDVDSRIYARAKELRELFPVNPS
jgi:hypothetical protein